jgi:hypothetical protein
MAEPERAEEGLSGQLTLTEETPRILDATCSYGMDRRPTKRRWPQYASIRIDIRPETKPDIVMDNTDLRFPDHYFDQIYYDPPHVIRRASDLKWLIFFQNYRKEHESRKSPGFFDRYGSWRSKEEFLENIKGVNREFYRCLKPDGRLFVKLGVEWSKRTRCITLREFLDRMTNFEILKDRVTISRSNLGKNRVHWLTAKPRRGDEQGP